MITKSKNHQSLNFIVIIVFNQILYFNVYIIYDYYLMYITITSFVGSCTIFTKSTNFRFYYFCNVIVMLRHDTIFRPYFTMLIFKYFRFSHFHFDIKGGYYII